MKISKKKINSIAVAFFLSVDALCYVLPVLGIGTYYRLMYTIEMVALALILIGNIAKNSIGLKLSIKKYGLSIVYFGFIGVVYSISSFIVPKFSYTLDLFIFCFAIGVIIISVDFNAEIVLTIMTIMSCLIIPSYAGVFAYQWESLNQASMGTAYAILTWVIAGFCHFIYFRKNYNRFFYIFYIPSIVGFVGILQFANRGTVLALITFAVLAYFNTQGVFNDDINKEMKRKRVKLIIIAILGFYVILNFNQLFLLVYDFLDSVLSEMPSFFVKMNRMITINDISNGRTDLYAAAIKGIFESPFIGHGIESFSYNTGFAYEHNFILQLLYEGGIFFCIVPLMTIIWLLYKLLFSQVRNRNILAVLIFLTVQVIPRFLVSGTIWTDRFFWLLIFYVFANRRNINEQRLNYNAGEFTL